MQPAQKQGSALLVTLLVTSLLVALLLAFSAVVRLELRQVQSRIEAMQARQNARLAIELAIAQLQTHAGVDQRATARADILGPGVDASSRFWTGVWTRNPDGTLASNPVWLVSGNNPDPQSGPANPDFLILSSTPATEAVRVPLLSISNPQGQTQGQIAYWVSDEASKASLQARRSNHILYQQAALLGTRRGVEYVSDFGVNLSPFFSNAGLDILDPGLNNQLNRAPSTQSLLLADDAQGNALSTPNIQLPLHDLTKQALGVLENSADGGLQHNLSDLLFRDSFLATEDTAKFLGPKTGVLPVETGLPSDRGIQPGDPFFSPRPLLTEAVLYVGLFHTWGDAKIRIRYHLQSEFLNPYSLPLEFPRDADALYDRALVIVFENLPTITVQDTTAGSLAPTITQNLNELSAYPATDFRRDLNSWVEIDTLGQPHVPQLKPGETYQVMEPNPGPQLRGLARDFGTVNWAGGSGTRPSNSAQIRITAVHPPEGVSLKGVPYLGSGAYRSRPVHFQWSGLSFDDFTITKTFNEGPNPFSRPASSTYLIDDYVFAYHFRLYSDETDPESLRDFLSGAHMLDPDVNAGAGFVDVEGNNRTHDEVLDPISADPAAIVADTINLFSKLDVFMDNTSRSHVEDYRKIVLIDVPDGDALSIGQLTHLPLYRQPLWTIGSPAGGEYNKAFDRYFFSPKQNHPTTGGSMLRSPALTPLTPPSDTPAHNDAASEMIDGAFNLNSTSEDAWFSVLSAPIITPSARDEASVGEKTRFGAFFRLPRQQSIQGDFAVNTPEIADPSHAFAQGIRSLDDSGTQAVLRGLASRIVTAIQSRGQPFGDLQSFVNSGILQAAIDAGPTINQGLFSHSNVHLLQQDILTKLAPTLRPRSDTFVIRAYGSTPGNAKAYCEALVQRLPEKVDASDPMTPANHITNHRMFRVISFRWLTDEEI